MRSALSKAAVSTRRIGLVISFLRFGPDRASSRITFQHSVGHRSVELGCLAYRPSTPCRRSSYDQSNKSSTAFDQATTLVTVVELSRNSWLVAGVVPGINRHPLKKLAADENELLALLHRWQQQAVKAGREIKRVVVAFEAGRDGFWLARWLRARGIEPHVIHATSIAVSREHRRAKTDRLDTEHLKRVVLGWLRGEPNHCRMVAIPTIEEEDARRPNRERETLIRETTRLVNRMKACLVRFGVRGFDPTLRKAADRLASFHHQTEVIP